MSLFGPLAIYYSQNLVNIIERSGGFSSIAKRQFLKLFWEAYIKAFTSENIASGWRSTGLRPWNPEVVLQYIKKPASRPSSSHTHSSIESINNIIQVYRLTRKAHGPRPTPEQVLLTDHMVHIQAQNEILKHTNAGLEEALKEERRRRFKPRKLPLLPGEAPVSQAQFISPAKVTAKMAQRAEMEEEARA